MLNIWNAQSGYSFGLFLENIPINIPLPLKTYYDPIKFEIISGKLPPGLRLEDRSIKGSAKEVVDFTTFKFCIRASYNNEISDRTFFMTIDGPDQPMFITEEGLLPVGPNQTYFVLDRTPIEFNIVAEDFDTAAGQELRFFISSGDGELPPGLKLDSNGRVHGLIDPLLSVFISDRNGGFDSVNFDAYGFDFGIISDNGFDTFNYDQVTYDYSAPSRVPKKLNRNYEFVVSVSDGYSEIKKRKFRIYVVGEDFFKADNTVIRAASGFYRADNTDLRKPIWSTPANLGTLRANNFHIIKLDIYEVINYGVVQYYLEPNLNPTDPTSAISVLPPGMKLDIVSGELYGIIPYQEEYLKTYEFTVTATRFGRGEESGSVSKRFTVKIVGEIDSNIAWVTPANLGTLDVSLISNLKIEATSSLTNGKIRYALINGQLPPGLTLEPSGEIIGKINQYSSPGRKGLTTFYDTVNGQQISNLTFDNNQTTVDKIFKFVVRASDQTLYSAIDQEFTIEIGTPDNKLFSNIYVTTYMNLGKRQLFNDFINNEGIFPKGILYRPTDINYGIRRDLRMLMFAGIETRDASEYISMIGLNHKKKRFRFGEVKKAIATIPGTKQVVYEAVYVQMIDHQDFKDDKLPLNLTIDDFSKRHLDLTRKMVKANNVISAENSNYFWRSSDQELYVSNEPSVKRPLEYITVDRSDLQVSDYRSRVRYINTYTNWRKRIKSFKDLNGVTVVNQPKYLPLWMRSFQENRQDLGFNLALPLCFCLPNTSEEILLNIKNSNFDFKQLDFTVDRYIIDSVNGYGADKFLVFQNKEVVV